MTTGSQMEATLREVLAGTQGGPNRTRILVELHHRPRNANQLAERLDLDYKTVRHHLEVLREQDLVHRGGDGYGAIYLPTDRVRHCWDVVEEIADGVVGR